ncbi:DNA primase [Oleiagrimonas soli]|uniref:DNA primase n=1 Tax=Oleiagrimonas soli TaxID=1543381 RepID=A0A099CSR8_9GAMM|nr:DNA primase [Oleiagrimonas soli]KGI76672.1 DNA primase [Oleiagrimonas soli]MBB6185116.1 DNA primase [Oleiagrimonas soli]
MRGLIPESFIDDLLTRIDIVDVVERRVPLKKAGREWTACCPFHDERTPSFYVSPQKQFYHCFGCGAHGSAIKFLMDYERLEFPDAVEELAQSVGLDVPREGGDHRPREDRSGWYELLDQAATFYQKSLRENAQAKAYCEQRGLDAETIERFRIGWAPGGGTLLSRLGTTPERAKWLEQAGMVSTGDRGKYDRFRARLMFPIMDRRGRVIAFGGRILDGDGPKYLNSPETPLFHKGRELFGLWQCKQANASLTRLLVVEGYMDAIALHQAGLPIAVATLGTATTPEHTERLFRSAPDVVFCFDGDRAGRAAAWKALEAALPRLRDGRQAFFLFLPDGEDPDSLIRAEGKDGFERRLADATPLSTYFFDHLGEDIDLRSIDGRARLAERARPLIARLPDGAFRDLMAQELTARTGANARFETEAPPRAERPLPSRSVRRTLVRSAIALLLAQPELAEELEPPHAFARLDKPGVSLLIELIELIRARPGIRTGVLLEHFAEREEAAALQKLAMAEVVGDTGMQRSEFLDALKQMERQADLQRIDALQTALAQGQLDAAGKDELRARLAAKSKKAS